MFAMGFTPEGWATAAAAPNSMTRDHDRSAADLIVESPAMMPITAAVRLLAPPKETWKECRRSGLMPVVGGGDLETLFPIAWKLLRHLFAYRATRRA
jgi:hypothetical protein